MNTTLVGRVSYFVLRVAPALFYLQHGGQKLFAWFGGFGGHPGQTAPLASLMGVGGVLEFFGGCALLLGLLTRPVAFIICGEMAVAYFMAHFPHGFWPIQNHGEPAVLNCFIFLFFAANGAGPWSLDALLWGGRRRAAA